MVIGGNDGDSSQEVDILSLDPSERSDCVKELIHKFPAKLEGAMGTTLGGSISELSRRAICTPTTLLEGEDLVG